MVKNKQNDPVLVAVHQAMTNTTFLIFEIDDEPVAILDFKIYWYKFVGFRIPFGTCVFKI